MTEYLLAVTSVGALIVSVYNAVTNKRNRTSVRNLEAGKLDLGVAGLGLQALQAALAEMREQVEECHGERDEFRTILQANGLLPK